MLDAALAGATVAGASDWPAQPPVAARLAPRQIARTPFKLLLIITQL
jgi:hypothetical protein